MINNIKEIARLQRKVKKDYGVISVNSDNLTSVVTVQMFTLDDFLMVATQLHGVAEIKSRIGRIERLEFIRDGVSLFVLMDDKEDRKQWENMKKRHRL